MSMQMLEFGENLLHFFFKKLNVGIKELFNTVAAKIQKHWYFFQLLGACGLIDMDDIWKNVIKIRKNVSADGPFFNMLQEISKNTDFICIKHHLFDCSPE